MQQIKSKSKSKSKNKNRGKNTSFRFKNKEEREKEIEAGALLYLKNEYNLKKKNMVNANNSVINTKNNRNKNNIYIKKRVFKSTDEKRVNNINKINNEQENYKISYLPKKKYINRNRNKNLNKAIKFNLKDNFYVNLDETGNTVSSTILIGLKECLNSTVIKKFEKLLLEMDNAEELLRNAEKLIDNLNTAITSYQFGKYHGKDCIACYDQKGDLLYFDDGIECHVPSINDNLELCNNQEMCQQEFVPESDLYEVEGFTVGRMTKHLSKLKIKDGTVNKEGIEKNQFKKSIELKENKMKYKQSGAVEANMVGNIIGHFIANYDQFKKADLDNKKFMIRDAALPIASLLGRKIIGAIPVFKNTCLGSIFRNGFIIVSVFELCRNVFDVFFSDVLTTGEKIKIVAKKGLALAADIACSAISQAVSMKIALALGFVAGPGAIIIGGLVGIAFGFILY